MSGICGIYNYNIKNKADTYQLGKMAELIQHRGPYFHGTYADKNIGLAIQSSNKNTKQPSHNTNKSIWSIIDGTIYNKHELWNFIKKNEHAVITSCDQELLVNLYELLGEDFIKKVDGEFAFCIWDNTNNKLILGRNHSGNKPLYYYNTEAGIIFGSEIKSILANITVKREIDPAALDTYFTFFHVPTPDTLFCGIKQVPAGSLLICQDQKIRISHYWEFNNERINTGLGEEECSENLYELLRKAVKKRLEDQDNIGAFLSGGLDSTVVVSLIKKILNKKFKVFSVGFEEKEFNELPSAKRSAKFYDIDIFDVIVDIKKAIAALPKVIWHTDLPFWDISAIPTYYAGLTANKHVNLVLTGDGSDQLLAGSTSYAYWKRQAYLFPEFLRTKILAKVIKPFDNLNINKIFLRKILKNAKIESLPLEQRFSIRSSTFNRIKEEAYNHDFRNQITENIFLKVNNRFFQKSKRDNFIDKLLYKDVLFMVQDDLLVKVDRMLNANSLEWRTPFLDIDVMNFISTIPIEYKIKGIWNPNKKYILKKAFKKNLPPHILTGKKMGFAPPQRKWMKENLKEIILDNILINNTGLKNYFNIKFINKIIDQFYKEEYDHNLGFIWALFVFEIWYKTYIANKDLNPPIL